MSHKVKCKYCGAEFDRDKEAYVELTPKKFAHARCHAIELVKDPTLPKLEIHDLTDIVTCKYCGKKFNKALLPYALIGKNRYAHLECQELESTREKTPEEKLSNYICDLFDTSFVPPRIQKQINKYITEYDYSYSGIESTLRFFYEVQHHDLDKANDGIGIVPYIYKQAYNYYKTIYEANAKNNQKNLSNYKPKVEEITIPPPEVKIDKPKLFNFIDLDEIEGDSE